MGLQKKIILALFLFVLWNLAVVEWVNRFGSNLLVVWLKSFGLLFAGTCIYFAYQIQLSLTLTFDPKARLERLQAQQKEYENQQKRCQAEIKRLEQAAKRKVISSEPRRLGGRVSFEVKVGFFLVFAILLGHSLWLLNHEGRMTDLEAWKQVANLQMENLGKKIDDVKTYVDGKVNTVAEEMNSKYADLIKDQDSHWKTFDDALLSFAALVKRVDKNEQDLDKVYGAPSLRNWLGLGCFPQGTLIQLDAEGSQLAPIETLRRGHFIWNPDLQMQVKLSLTVVGNETGILYTFKTADGLLVRVTSTHPMKIMKGHPLGSDPFTWVNLAAKDVQEGSWTQTINGVQQIVSIEKMEVVDLTVFNLEYALNERVPLTSRSIIADGVQILDFAAQRKHHL